MTIQTSELIKLRQFVADLFWAFNWPDSEGLETGEFQDIAENYGILIQETRTSPCADKCWCEEYYSKDEWKDGVICYKKVDWLCEIESERATRQK